MVFECKDIHKAYGKNRILKGVSFSVSGGETVGFAGDNGCGKSTLLSILAGVERADKGQITLDGRNILRMGDISGRIGYVPQTDPLPPELKVGECLKLWCKSRTDLERAVSDYDLSDILKKKISKLSGGMRRRVSFACAAASSPDVMILDEPTAALDMHYKKIIREDILRMAEAGCAVILVSHDAEELAMCNTCYKITAGKATSV